MQFDTRKIGTDEISSEFSRKLEDDFHKLQSEMNVTLESYSQSVEYYNDNLLKLLATVDYFSSNDLMLHHHNVSKEALSQV